MSARKQFLKIGIPKYVSIRKTEVLVISDQAVVKIAQQSFNLVYLFFRTSVFVDPFTEVDEQLAKERAEELAKTREKEQNLMAKKKQVDPAGLKAYSKGVGKFINPNLKKKAQKIDDEDLATPVVKKKKQIKKSMNDFSGW